MTVYLVYGCYEYEWQLTQIFSSREAAESYIKVEVEVNCQVLQKEYRYDTTRLVTCWL